MKTLRNDYTGPAACGLSLKARSQDQPLLPYQQYFLDYQLYSPDKVTMNISIFCSIPAGAVDVLSLKKAVDKVFRHYAIFGTVFTFNDDGDLVQRYRPELIPDIGIVKSSEEAFEQHEKNDFIRPFRMLDSILWRHQILVTEEHIYLMTDFHHCIGDKGMCMLIYRQIFDVMNGSEPGADHYYLYLSRYAEKMKSARASEDLRQLEHLYGGDYSRFPTPDVISRENSNARCILQTDHSLEYYQNAARRCGVTLGTALSAAGLSALSRYNHQPKVEIEWMYHGRHEPWKKEIAGLMLSGIPAAMDFGTLRTPEEILKEAMRQKELGYRYEEYSYALHNMSPAVYEHMKVCFLPGNDDPGNLPKGSSMTVYMGAMEGMLALAQIIITHSGAGDPLTLISAYQGTRYHPESIEKLLRLYLEALNELLSEP